MLQHHFIKAVFLFFMLFLQAQGTHAQKIAYTDIAPEASMPSALLANAYFPSVKVNSDLIDDYCYIENTDSILYCAVSSAGVYAKNLISKKIDQAGWANSYMMADINNDGRADFCQLVDNWTKLQCYTSKGEGADTSFDLAFTSEYLDGGWAGYRWLMDVDGDGKADFCRVTGSRSYKLSCRQMGNGVLGTKEYESTSFSSWPKDRVAYWFDSTGDGFSDFHMFFDNENGADMMIRFRNRVSASQGFTGESSSIILTAVERVGSLVTNAQGHGTASFCYLKNQNALTCQDINSAITGETKTYFSSAIEDPGWSDSRMWTDLNGDGYIDYCALRYHWTVMSCWIQNTTGIFTNQESKYIDGGYNYWGVSTQDLNGMADSRHWIQIGSKYNAYTRIVGGAPNTRLAILATSDSADQMCQVAGGSTPASRMLQKPTLPPNPPTKEPQVSTVYRYDERSSDVIFREGFMARGTNTDVLDHVSGDFRLDQSYIYTQEQLQAMNSAYVATTSNTDFVMNRALSYFNTFYRQYRNNPSARLQNNFNSYEIQANDRMYSLRNSFIAVWAEAIQSTASRGDRFASAWNTFIDPPSSGGAVAQQEWLARDGVAREDIRSVTSYRIPSDFFDQDPARQVTRSDLISATTSNPNFRARQSPLTSSYVLNVAVTGDSVGQSVMRTVPSAQPAENYYNRRLEWPSGVRAFLRDSLRFSCFGVRDSSSERLQSANSSSSPACLTLSIKGGSDNSKIRPVREYQVNHPCAENQ